MEEAAFNTKEKHYEMLIVAERWDTVWAIPGGTTRKEKAQMGEEPVIEAIIFSSFIWKKKKIKSIHKYQAEVMKKKNIKTCLLEIPGLSIKTKHIHFQIDRKVQGENQETFIGHIESSQGIYKFRRKDLGYNSMTSFIWSHTHTQKGNLRDI